MRCRRRANPAGAAQRRSGPGPARAGQRFIGRHRLDPRPGCCPQYATADGYPRERLMQAATAAAGALHRAVAAVVGVAGGGRVRPGRDRGGAAGRAGAGQEPAVGRGEARGCGAAAGPGGGAGGAAAPVGGRAVHPVRAGPVASGAADAAHEPAVHRPAGACRISIRRICRCRGNGPSSRTARRRSAAISRWRTPSPPRSGGCGRPGWSA